MKNVLCFLSIMFAALIAQAQTCELRNTSTQTVSVRIMAYRGSTTYVTNVISLPASTTIGPSTVASASWPWTGATPPAGAYVIGFHVEVPSCSDVFDLDNANNNHISCPGPSQIESSFENIGGLGVMLRVN